MATTRRDMMLAALAAAAASACGNGANAGAGASKCTAKGGVSGAALRAELETKDDRAIGSPDAPIHLIEYASVVCPYCEQWHTTVYPTIKEKYIDTGKARFVFREIPTEPVEFAMAGFLLARCAPEEKYFDVLSVLFKQRAEIMKAARDGAAREVYLRIARSAGVEEAKFDACLKDREGVLRIGEVAEKGVARWKLEGTPSFIVNGEYKKNLYSVEDFTAALDSLLACP